MMNKSFTMVRFKNCFFLDLNFESFSYGYKYGDG